MHGVCALVQESKSYADAASTGDHMHIVLQFEKGVRPTFPHTGFGIIIWLFSGESIFVTLEHVGASSILQNYLCYFIFLPKLHF
jgi:hypothetical protein